jgi:hypothetical protein
MMLVFGIQLARYGIGKHGKAEHILHRIDFLRGKLGINLAHVAIMLDCILRVEAVLAQCQCMCPLSVAVECGRWLLINSVVRPGMVASSSLRSSA